MVRKQVGDNLLPTERHAHKTTRTLAGSRSRTGTGERGRRRGPKAGFFHCKGKSPCTRLYKASFALDCTIQCEMDGMDDWLADLLSAVHSSSLLLLDDLSPGTHVQNLTVDISVFRITIRTRVHAATSYCRSATLLQPPARSC
jgi:hypothetical protein